MDIDDPRFHGTPRVRPVQVTNKHNLFDGVFFPLSFPHEDCSNGLWVDVTDGTRRLSARPYCWCERGTCPWCSGSLDTEDWRADGGSAHALLEAPNTWAALGFVQGQGAPHLRYQDPEAGIDVRLWWYKTTGRDLTGFFQGMHHNLPKFLAMVRPLVLAEQVRREQDTDGTLAWSNQQWDAPWTCPVLVTPLGVAR